MFRRKTADGSVSALATPGETTRCDADLGAVTEVVSVLDDARTLTGGASDAMSVLCARFDWSCGFYWAADYEGSAMRVVAQAGSVPGDFRAASEGAVLLPGEGVAGRAWKSGTWLLPRWLLVTPVSVMQRRSGSVLSLSWRSRWLMRARLLGWWSFLCGTRWN